MVFDVAGAGADGDAVHNHHAAVHVVGAVRAGGADSDRRRPGQTFITFLFDRGELFVIFRDFYEFSNIFSLKYQKFKFIFSNFREFQYEGVEKISRKRLRRRFFHVTVNLK